MIPLQDLDKLIKDRREDVKVLFDAGRFDGAFYFCGYVMEIGLKKKICEALGWQSYPPGNHNDLKSFKTHELEVLLMILGKDVFVKKNFLSEWSIVTTWKSEKRYSPGVCTDQDVANMMNAVDVILKNI